MQRFERSWVLAGIAVSVLFGALYALGPLSEADAQSASRRRRAKAVARQVIDTPRPTTIKPKDYFLLGYEFERKQIVCGLTAQKNKKKKTWSPGIIQKKTRFTTLAALITAYRAKIKELKRKSQPVAKLQKGRTELTALQKYLKPLCASGTTPVATAVPTTGSGSPHPTAVPSKAPTPVATATAAPAASVTPRATATPTKAPTSTPAKATPYPTTSPGCVPCFNSTQQTTGCFGIPDGSVGSASSGKNFFTTYCSSCHTFSSRKDLPYGLVKYAVNNISSMSGLRSLPSQTIIDITAYINQMNPMNCQSDWDD